MLFFFHSHRILCPATFSPVCCILGPVAPDRGDNEFAAATTGTSHCMHPITCRCDYRLFLEFCRLHLQAMHPASSSLIVTVFSLSPHSFSNCRRMETRMTFDLWTTVCTLLTSSLVVIPTQMVLSRSSSLVVLRKCHHSRHPV